MLFITIVNMYNRVVSNPNKNKYTSKEMRMFEDGYVYDENHTLVKNPNIETPVRVLNPLTYQKIKLSSLYNMKEYRDGKMEYDIETNTIRVVDEDLKAEIQKRLDDGLIEKVNERLKKREKAEKEKPMKEALKRMYLKKGLALGIDVDEFWKYRQLRNPLYEPYDEYDDY